jgi:hypothetical protein
MQPNDVTPLTTLAGWRQFVSRSAVPPPLLSEEQWRALGGDAKAEYDEERIAYHAQLMALETPELRKILTTGRTLLMLNQRQYGARTGLLVTGEPTTGKSTAITELGRAVELAYRRSRPYREDAAPVVYLTMPPQATPKSLSIEILKFLGAPYLPRDSQIELMRQACFLLADLRTELIIVDEIHNLNHATRAGADASDHLKYLAENAATFVYAGIDTARTGLHSGVGGVSSRGVSCQEFLLGQKVVGEDPVQLPDFVEFLKFRGGVVAEVADQFTDPGPVLLHVGAVVLVPRPGPGEGDLVCMAVGQQVLVDELGAVVRIDPNDGKREHSGDMLKSLEDPFGRLVPHGPVHRPAGGDVGHRQGEAELPEAVASFVADQINLVVPLGPGPDRDLGFQEGAGLGV